MHRFHYTINETFNEKQTLEISNAVVTRANPNFIPRNVMASKRKSQSINKLKEGDLLEIDRGLYKHWAVYIGKNIHIGFVSVFFILVHP